jgi:hypothetical protein
MNRPAKDRAEYDRASELLAWLRARGREMVIAGQENEARALAMAIKVIEKLFLFPT